MLAAGAHAFLRRGGALIIALLDAKKNVLELVHACIRKKQSRVADGHQRRAAHHAVAVLREEIQECAANLMAGKHVSRFRWELWQTHTGAAMRADANAAL